MQRVCVKGNCWEAAIIPSLSVTVAVDAVCMSKPEQIGQSSANSAMERPP